MPVVKILYTDLDGTCVHYEGFDDAEAAGLLALPPSSTGRAGAISRGALERYAAARAAGARLVVVTGARTPTLLQRLPFVPRADAYVSENGGRVFYPPEVARELGGRLIAATAAPPSAGGKEQAASAKDDDDATAAAAAAAAAVADPLPVACPLVEDLAWRAMLQGVCGPAREEATGVPPARRTGPLWALYRRLAEGGWAVDATGYATAFRVQQQNQRPKGAAADAAAAAGGGNGGGDSGEAIKNGDGGGDDDREAAEAALRAVANSRPAGVACSTNLGVLDFYPALSGKEGAARRLERLFSAAAARGDAAAPTVLRTAFLCDDDNDLALAAHVGRAFVPTFGSASMEAAVRAEQRRAAEAGDAPRFVTPPPALALAVAPPPPLVPPPDGAAAAAAAPLTSAAARCAAATEAMIEAATAWLNEGEAQVAAAADDAAPKDGAAAALAAAR